MSFRKDYPLTASACCLLATLLLLYVPSGPARAAAVADTVASHADVSLLAGRTEMRGAGQDSVGWSLDYRRQLGGVLGMGLTYLNEGHHSDHHRDGYAAQVLLRAPIDGPVSLWLGAGPYAYFDTSTGGRPWHVNDHGLGMLFSAGASVALSGPWSLQARLHRVAARKAFDSNMLLVGVGYALDDHPGIASSDGSRRHEVLVHGGTAIVNSMRSEHDGVIGLEYRYRVSPTREVSAGLLHEGETALTERRGLSAQGWLMHPFPNGRSAMGVGAGVYVSKNDRVAGVTDSTRVNGLLSVTYRHDIGASWTARATWHRVVTSNDRDADMLLVGLGYRF